MNDTDRRPEWLEEDEQVLASLFDEAGPRLELPASLRVATEEAWQGKVRERRVRRTRVWSLAAAAGVASAVGLFLWWGFGRGVARGGEPVAIVEAAGDGLTVGGGSAAVGFEVPARTLLETAATDRAALRLASGAALRLDRGTRAALLSADRARLEAGAVYFDSGIARSGERPFVVETPFGAVEDVGTQFEIRLLAESLRLRVREGRVDLTRGGDRHSATRGEELTVDEASGVRRGRIALFGEPWAWAEELANPFVLDGRTLAELFDWVARETGRELVYVSSAEEAAAADILLHGGSSEGLRPTEVLELAIGGTGLAYSLEGERLVVVLQP